MSVHIGYESKVLGNQTAELKNIEQFETEFSNARTFCFLHELKKLSEHNLIKGGDLQNAIVLVDRDKVKYADIKKLAHFLETGTSDKIPENLTVRPYKTFRAPNFDIPLR